MATSISVQAYMLMLSAFIQTDSLTLILLSASAVQIINELQMRNIPDAFDLCNAVVGDP